MTITVPYLGLVQIPIKTYTTTYAPIVAGWQFNQRSLTPMEAEFYGSVAPVTIQGAKGNIFTNAHITPFTVGSVAGTQNNSLGQCAWWNNTLGLVGQITNASAKTEPWGEIFALNLDGIGINQPALSLTQLKVIPNLSNSQSPAAALGWGGRAAAPLLSGGNTLGVLYSYTINLVNFFGVWDGANNIQGTIDPTYNTASRVFECCIPGSIGQNNALLGRNDAGTLTEFYSLANWFSGTVPQTQTVLFTQPTSCTVNIDTFMHADGNTPTIRPTTLGFMLLQQGALTVDGTTLSGWGIIVLPNFAGYYIVEITPTDIPSGNWNVGGGIGTLWPAIGDDGYLFIKQNNTGSTLFVSTGPVALPVTPGTATSRQRAWSYVLDGHTFYVMDMGVEGTFVYDVTTEQWAQFSTQGFAQWSVANGVMWGTRIVGGDLLSTDVWEVNGSTASDNGVDIAHVVTGGLASRSRIYRSVESVRLAVSKGQNDDPTTATINLRFSDDGGQTWSAFYPLTLTEGQTKGELSWTSMGSFNSPGRVFEFSDSGGPIRIDGADVFLDDFDEDEPQEQQK